MTSRVTMLLKRRMIELNIQEKSHDDGYAFQTTARSLYDVARAAQSRASAHLGYGFCRVVEKSSNGCAKTAAQVETTTCCG
jgi:hypothetical protein